MPSQTYFNLPLGKRKRLLNAAIKEFSNVSFHDASINRIIKEAGISRGSFYVYFKDKDDLYEYILSRHFIKMEEVFLACLKDYNGDIFKASSKFFDCILTYISKNDKNLLTNTFLNLSFEKTYKWKEKNFFLYDQNRIFDCVIVCMDLCLLFSDDRKDIEVMLEMLFMVIMKNLADYKLFEKTFDEANESFHKHLLLLEYGFRKKEDLC